MTQASVSDGSDEIPGAQQQGPIALIGGVLHPVDGPVIKGGTVVFDGGKITAIGLDVEVPKGARRVDVSGQHVYPGLFEARTTLGLLEVEAVRASDDQSEVGSINPNVKSWVSVNPDSELIPVARANGVLLALTAPQGGLLCGRSAVLQLDGWTYEEMTLKGDVAMHLTWPRMEPRFLWWESETAKEQMEHRDEALEAIRKAFDDARAYIRARDAAPDKQRVDVRWEAMRAVLNGKQPLIVAADSARQIEAAVAFGARERVRVIIYGGYDALHCTELLKRHDVAVIIKGTYRLPRRRDEAYDAAYTLPARLHAAGVRYCLAGSGNMGPSDVRNLPYDAGMAAAFGLTPAQALAAITLKPAEILGVADRVGSLTVGKDATMFVADGDILETPTHVTAAWIAGRVVDLNNRHKRLWKKYGLKIDRAK